MADDRSDTTTRRRYLGATTAALGGALTGCAGYSPVGGGSGDDSYTVEMAPVGEVTFDDVPEDVTGYNPDWIDMAVALGHGDAVNSVWYRPRYKTRHYDEFEGVSMDVSELTPLYSDSLPKEIFYEVDGDVHLMDPEFLVNSWENWERSDVEEITDRVAPFFGNSIFRRTDDWHDYQYYTLYEAFEKAAALFQERERFEALRSIHESLTNEIETRTPGPDDRPNAALLWQGSDEPETFFPYRLSGRGANKEHFHTLGITDAFASTGVDGLSTSNRGTIDYETLISVDPDAILLRGHGDKSRAEFEDTVLAFMQEDTTASQLTAVQNGTVFRGGPIYAGPLHNFVLLERFATQFFPEEFTEDQLFDRDRVAEIVRGEI